MKLVKRNFDQVATASDACTLARQHSRTHGQNLKKLLAGYIVEETFLISTVDSPSFQHIIEKIMVKSQTATEKDVCWLPGEKI